MNDGVPGWESAAKRPEAAGCPRCVLSLGLGCLVWLIEAQQQQQRSSVSCKPADDAGGLIIIEIITMVIDNPCLYTRHSAWPMPSSFKV